jgi:hypothetical protein
MRIATMTMCVDDATTMKGWALFGPPDKFDVPDTAVPAA